MKENKKPGEKPSDKGENQQQTQPNEIENKDRNRVTEVKGECPFTLPQTLQTNVNIKR